MNQQEFWQQKWAEHKRPLPTNLFAKRAWKLIEQGNYKTFLNLGAGTGNDSFYFAKKGLQVTALDWSSSATQALRQRASEQHIENLHTKTQSIANLSFPANSFDVVYAHLSLHYFTHKQTTRIFKKLHNILTPGGLLFVKCKSIDDAYYGNGTEIEPDMFDHKGHVRHFFSKEYMRQQLESFTIISLRRTRSVYVLYKASYIEAVAQKEK